MKTRRMEAKKGKNAALLLALVMCVSCLPACAAPDEPAHKPWHPPAPAETTGDPGPAATPEKDPEPSAEEPSEKPEEPAAGTEEAPVENTPAEPDPSSVQSIARLGELVGNYAIEAFYYNYGTWVFVDTESSHNPYDLTWRYGPDTKHMDEVSDPAWDDLYEAYVDACDWSLVFDADYYKKAFPMLAKLYHENDALLLEHFQTQGVHEGRQASADFNVAAYMENCDKALAKAFGENYECYYFYYMLNQDTQRDVDVSNRGGAYPRWLALELSLQQSNEYRKVNEYRTEVGAAPVALHPEMVAFASYRAWYDAEHNLYAHDWTTNPDTSHDVNDCLWRISRDHLAENTVKRYHANSWNFFANFAINYRYSQDHYEAMVAEQYAYFGCSNPYWSDNPSNVSKDNTGTGYACQFDMFTEVQPQTPYKLD